MKTKKFKLAAIAMIVLGVAFILSACEAATTAYTDQSVKVNSQQQLYDRTLPLPVFDYSVERDAFIQIYKFRVNAISTYSVVTYPLGGVAFRCASIGYPIPADTQLTNPVVAMGNNYQGSVIDQPEPNGLFSSKNTVGTWVLCTQPDGTVYPLYTELSVTAWPFPVVEGEKGGLNFAPAQGAKPSGAINLQK